MSDPQPEYVPTLSDVAVKAKTGRDWAGWFGLLDEAGASKLQHAEIAKLVRQALGVPRWWCQMVAVEYERTRGLRARHQKADGYSVSVSKTIAAPLSALYKATADAARRRKWFAKGTCEATSQTQNKYFRGSWNESCRVEIGFNAKGPGKAQIALQISKLPDAASVETERAAWQTALATLQTMLETPAPKASEKASRRTSTSRATRGAGGARPAAKRVAKSGTPRRASGARPLAKSAAKSPRRGKGAKSAR